MLHLESLQNPTELWVRLSILWEQFGGVDTENWETTPSCLNLKYRYSDFLSHVV
jgi:hypothetical protein